MAIYAPNKRINPTIKRRSGGRKTVYASLFLTSMVDMFAILVIFLLQSFSSQGEIIVLPSGVELPRAVNTGQLERNPSIVIGQDQLLFEGKEIAKTAEIEKQKDWNIPALQKALQEFKTNLEAQAIAAGDVQSGTEKAQQKINISADKRLTFEVVKKVIYTAGFAGFPDFRFAVYPEGPLSTNKIPAQH